MEDSQAIEDAEDAVTDSVSVTPSPMRCLELAPTMEKAEGLERGKSTFHLGNHIFSLGVCTK